MKALTRMAARVGAAALLLAVAACGGDHEAAEKDGDKAADVSTCSAEAKAVAAPYGGQFPEGWPFPPGTTVYDVEDRGDQGTILTAISTAPFQSILDFLNHDVVDAGFTITSGESEEHDAEAEWTGHEHRGRWAIRKSAHCPGETVVQVLAAESVS